MPRAPSLVFCFRPRRVPRSAAEKVGDKDGKASLSEGDGKRLGFAVIVAEDVCEEKDAVGIGRLVAGRRLREPGGDFGAIRRAKG